MSQTLDRPTLLEEIHRLHDDLGRVPTATDMREHGDHSTTPYYSHFDGWEDALEQAGLERQDTEQGPTKEELLEAIHDLAADLGRTPTQTEMNDRGEFSQHPYYTKFDGWNDALEAADLEPNHEYVSDEELLESLREAAEELGRDPLAAEIGDMTGYARTTYSSRFGSWLEAREAAGLSGTEVKFNRSISPDDLLEDLKRLGGMVGRAPTQTEINTFGKFSHQSYYRAFNSLIDALERAGFEMHEADREWPTDYPDDWLDRAEKVRERDGQQCVVCGMTRDEHLNQYDTELNVHHVASETDPDALQNLVTICKGCHAKWDRVKKDPREI